MIRIRGLRKSFGARIVLDGIDLEIEAGAIVAILGASGSGKSTLLRCLNGLEPFDSGRIEIAGHVLDPLHESHVRLSGDVGMVFQEFHLFPHMSVLDNLTIGPCRVRGTSRLEAERGARELLEMVGLAERASAPGCAARSEARTQGASSGAARRLSARFGEPSWALESMRTRCGIV